MLHCNIEEFSKKLREKNKRPLRTLSIELTRNCNFKCSHCFCVSANPPQQRLQSGLPLNFWQDILDQSADEGGLFLTFTGGEPLLHRDFIELWKYAKQKGYLVTLFTNGSLITDEYADFFAQWTPSEISISLYGASESTYNKITGKKGMFRKVMEGLDLLASRQINVEVKGIFSKINVNDFDKVKEIALKYCNLFRWDTELLGSYSECTNIPAEIRLSPEECVALEQKDPVRLQQIANAAKRKPLIGEVSKRAARCNVGNGGVHIDYNGKMHPCILLEGYKYDLTTGSVREGWRKSIPKMLEDMDITPEGPCLSCSAVELCGQCVGFAHLEGDPLTGPVPFRCQLTRSRADFHGVLHNYPEFNK